MAPAYASTPREANWATSENLQACVGKVCVPGPKVTQIALAVQVPCYLDLPPGIPCMMCAKTYIVEHLDEELGPWSELEYLTIAKESHEANANFCLSSVPKSLLIPESLKEISGFTADERSVEDIYDDKGRICLLDPAAPQELSPDDGEQFDIFLFGGILGDDPPRDRTSELRKKGFTGRRLGPKQMTTDTAVRVTRLVVQNKVQLNRISYIDFPEIRIDKNESTEMPFRYVKDRAGQPMMPEGMIDLIKKDSEKDFGDLL